jgi:adenylate cyclase
VRGDEIIDVDVDPHEVRRQRWRRLVRFGIPLAGVLLIVGAIIATALYSYRSNRSDALELSQSLIDVLDERVRAEVESYLGPAAQAVRTLAGMVPAESLSASARPSIERLAMQLLDDRPQLASLFVGDPAGNFLMVQRSAAGALDTKIIEHDDAGRRVTWYRRDDAGEVTAVEEDPADTFDPRTRPWYRGATTTRGLFWTDVYVYFTSQAPGLTASSAVSAPDGELVAVVGGDITLAALSDFLAGLEIGTTGRAMIIEAGGQLVAFPDPGAVVDASAGELRPAHIDAIGDPLLAEAYDRIRVAGDGHSIVEIDGRRIIVGASTLANQKASGWRLLLVVPEDELVGFVGANSRRSLWLSSGIVALAIGLAGLLASQGLIADRNARALRRRERALAGQTAAFDELASNAALFDDSDRQALGRLTETVGRALAARRTSLWRFDDGAGDLSCLDCYDQEAKGHATGATIHRAECPELLDALARGDEIAADDAAQDPRTAKLAEVYLGPLGCRALLSVPIATRHGVLGCVWIEDAGKLGHQGVDARPFTRTIAHLLALRLERAAAPESLAPATAAAAAGGVPAATSAPAGPALAVPGSALRTTSLSDERSRTLLRQMSGRNLSEDRLLGAVYPEVSVLVLRLFDDLAMAAAADGEEQIGVIEQIVAAFQEMARDREVRYVKIMTNEIVAAEGFDGDAAAAALTLGEVALGLQEQCARSFGQVGRRLDFALGLDTGAVIGSAVGFGQTAYNLWGDAVRVASSLAMTAPRGAIQISEASYERLRGGFVFRPQGRFYLEQVGEMTTYVLRGRL